MTKTVRGPDGLVVNFPDDTDEATINRVMQEAYQAKQQAAQASQPAPKPQQPIPAAPQSGLDKFITGLDRLPNLVGIGNVSSGFTKADVSAEEARGRFAQGSGQALQATGRGATNVLGPLDDYVIAGISEAGDAITGQDTGSFGDKVQRSEAQADQLREDQPLANFLGEVMGFGGTGTVLRQGAARRGVNIGVGGEAAIMAGGHALLEGEGIEDAAVDAALGFAGGKLFEGVGDRVVAPLVNKFLPGGQKALGSEIDEQLVRRIANRTDEDAADIRAAVENFTNANGRAPKLAEISDPATIRKYRNLGVERPAVNAIFRESEEVAARTRGEDIAGAVRRTGDTVTPTQARTSLDELAASDVADAAAQNAARLGRVDEIATNAKRDVRADRNQKIENITATTNDDIRAAADDATGFRREVDEQAGAAQAAITGEATATARSIQDQALRRVEGQQAAIAKEGERLSAQLQELTARPPNAQSAKAVEAAIDKYGDDVMRDKATGLASREIELSDEFVSSNLPLKPIQQVLKSRIDALPANAEQQRLIDLAEKLSDGQGTKLTIDDIDVLRRTARDAVDANNVKFNLNEVADTLADEAGRQVPEYGQFLERYRGLQRGLDAYKVANAGVLGAKPTTAAADIRLATAEGAGAEGALDGALVAIGEKSRGGAEALKVAARLARNEDAVRAALGDAADVILKPAARATKRVAAIEREISEIKEAAANTILGVKDDAARQIAKIDADALKAKQGSTDAQTARTRELSDSARQQKARVREAAQAKTDRINDVTAKKVAALQEEGKRTIAAIQSQLGKNRDAVDAAANVLSRTTKDFDSALSGASPDVRNNAGAVAREAVAGAAEQSPDAALRVARDLQTPGIKGRIESVTDTKTAQTLEQIGATQQKSAANQYTLSARDPKDLGVAPEVNSAIELAAALGGRAGPGYIVAALRRALSVASKRTLSDKAAEELARAFVRQDAAYVTELLDRLTATQKQRDAVLDVIERASSALAAEQVASFER